MYDHHPRGPGPAIRLVYEPESEPESEPEPEQYSTTECESCGWSEAMFWEQVNEEVIKRVEEIKQQWEAEYEREAERQRNEYARQKDVNECMQVAGAIRHARQTKAKQDKKKARQDRKKAKAWERSIMRGWL